MSNSALEKAETLMYSKDDQWNSSIESIIIQKVTKLTKSMSTFKILSNLDVTFSEQELREINVEESKPKAKWEFVRNKSRFPRMILTRSLLRDELEMLKINMSVHEKPAALRESQMLQVRQNEARRKTKKIKHWWDSKLVPAKVQDLLTEIEGSEYAKTDKVIWKFLKRGPSLRREFINARNFLSGIQLLSMPNSHIQCTQPTRITCPNCRFFIVTNVRRVSTIRTKLTSFALTIFGLCIIPHVFHAFKDTVHLCPLCKIYLGFCPAFGIRSRRGTLRSFQPTSEEIFKAEDKKMVSASSTSAKNLFVESKLRLSDRVQVNVNNIAAVARQIQRGSKSNENVIAAAKNFALQEAAIENSETNLKKLKLLTTHINNQLDSLHNSASKMESVLEQVRSMQR